MIKISLYRAGPNQFMVVLYIVWRGINRWWKSLDPLPHFAPKRMMFSRVLEFPMDTSTSSLWSPRPWFFDKVPGMPRGWCGIPSLMMVRVPSWSDCSGKFGLRVAARKGCISSHNIGGKRPNMVTWCQQTSFLFHRAFSVLTMRSGQQFEPLFQSSVNGLPQWELISIYSIFWSVVVFFSKVKSTSSQMESDGIVWNLVSSYLVFWRIGFADLYQ